MQNIQATAKDGPLKDTPLGDFSVQIKGMQPTGRVKKKVVVHLGNVGDRGKDEMPLDKTLRYSDRFTDVTFIGIDLKPTPGRSQLPGNVTQLCVDFLTGLGKIEDSSVDIISSEMGLGYYDGLGREYEPTTGGKISWRGSMMNMGEIQAHNRGIMEYTKDVLAVAYDKLKVGGILIIAIDGSAFNILKVALDESKFEDDKVKIRGFTDAEKERTLWTRQFSSHGNTIYQISARK